MTVLAVGVQFTVVERKLKAVAVPAPGLDLDDADRMGHRDLDGTVRQRSPESSLGVQRAPVVECRRALHIRDEGFAVVPEGHPLAVAESATRTPLPLSFAVPIAEQLREPSKIRVRGRLRRHVPSVARVEEAPASALATIGRVSEIDGIERVLVVVAHPDDCDFGNAATTAKWTDAGVTVSYCIVTDGDAGGSDRSITREQMAGIRRIEQTEAAAEVGVTDITFLGYPDGRLTPSIELRRDISRVIRVKQPQRVITQSPVRSFTRIFASHPDHLAAGEATLCAVYPDSRNPFAHRELLEVEGLEPYSVAEVWMSAAGARVWTSRSSMSPRPPTASWQHFAAIAASTATGTRSSSEFAAGSRLTAKTNGLEEGHLAEQFVVIPTA